MQGDEDSSCLPSSLFAQLCCYNIYCCPLNHFNHLWTKTLALYFSDTLGIMGGERRTDIMTVPKEADNPCGTKRAVIYSSFSCFTCNYLLPEREVRGGFILTHMFVDVQWYCDYIKFWIMCSWETDVVNVSILRCSSYVKKHVYLNIWKSYLVSKTQNWFDWMSLISICESCCSNHFKWLISFRVTLTSTDRTTAFFFIE